MPLISFDKRYGGNGLDDCRDVLKQKDGSMILIGGTTSMVGFDISIPPKGGFDQWIINIDSSGNKLWDNRYGGSGQDGAEGAVLTSNGGLLIYGGSDSWVGGDKSQPPWGSDDFWIVRTDSAGTKLWDRRFGGTNLDILWDAIETDDMGFLLAGQTYSGTGGDRVQPLWNSPGIGHGDFWAVKTDSSGNMLWEHVYGGNQNDEGRTVVLTGNNGYLLGGSSKSYVSGQVSQPPRGAKDYWIIRIDSTGNKIWDKRYGGIYDNCGGESFLRRIITMPDGGFLLAGYSDADAGYEKTENCRGDTDYWIIRVDSLGNKLWDRTIGGGRSDILHHALMLSDGFLLGGSSTSGVGSEKSQPNRDPTLNTYDYWIVKTDFLGYKQWDITLGGSSNDYCYRMTLTPDSGLMVAGASRSPVSGEKTQPSLGGYDYWVVKLTLPASSGIGETPILPVVSVYPNPFSSTITVTAENIPGHIATLTLRNLLGEEILSQQTPVIERTLQKQLAVPPLPPGMYLLTLATESGNQVLKVVKGN